MQNRCVHCDLPFTADHFTDELCPSCEAIEKAQYAPKPDLPFTPWRHSKTAMRERLGVSGDRDE